MKKKQLIIVGVIILLVFVGLSGCISNRRYSIEHLSLSYYGSKLVSITENTGNTERGRDVQVWDVNSGKVLWSLFGDYDSNEAFFSSDGKYLVFNSLIYNISSNETIDISNFCDWSYDEEIYVTLNSSNSIDIYSSINFSKIKTIELNEMENIGLRMKFSPITSEIAFLPENKKSIYLINLTTGTLEPFENTSFNFSKEFSKYTDAIQTFNNNHITYQQYLKAEYHPMFHDNGITWSKDGQKIALTFIERRDYYPSNMDPEKYYFSDKYYCHVFIWERQNKSLLEHLEIDINSFDGDRELDHIDVPFLSPDFQNYGHLRVPLSSSNDNSKGIWDSENALFEVYNISNSNKVFDLKVGHAGGDLPFDWSHDGRIIATGNDDGSIYLWNASTGKKINALNTPSHEVDIPGFEIILVMCAIALVLFLKRKRKM